MPTNNAPQQPDMASMLDDDTIQEILAAIHHGRHPLSMPGGPLGIQPAAKPAPLDATTPTPTTGLPGPGPKKISPVSQVAAGLAPTATSKLATAAATKLATGAATKAIPYVGPVVGAATELGMSAAKGEPVTGEDVGSAVGGAAGGIGGAAGGAALGAAVGTVVPGIGNAIGAAVGAAVGGAAGGAAGGAGGAAIGRASGGGKARAAFKPTQPFGSQFAPGGGGFSGVGQNPMPQTGF